MKLLETQSKTTTTTYEFDSENRQNKETIVDVVNSDSKVYTQTKTTYWFFSNNGMIDKEIVEEENKIEEV